MKLKLFAFVAWMGTEENTPRVSACTLDTETGDTIFDTVCMDSSLIFPLKNRLSEQSPDVLLCYDETLILKTLDKSLYPRDGKPILKDVVSDIDKRFRFAGQDVLLRTREDVTKVYGSGNEHRFFQALSSHLKRPPWERFCFSLCAFYLSHQKMEREKRLAEAARQKHKNAVAVNEGILQTEREVAEKVKDRERTLAKLQALDVL